MRDTMQLKRMFLEAPDGHLAAELQPLIQKWSEPTAKAIEVLEVLDQVVHTGGGSEFSVLALKHMLEMLMEEEGTNMDELVKLATWRNA